MRKLQTLVAAMAALGLAHASATAHETIAGPLVILHPHTIEPAEDGVRDADVYMIIRNTGADADRLIAVSSPLAASARFERSAADGVAGSTVIAAIDLPGGRETTIGPRGVHIRLSGLSVPLTGYASLPLMLTFERAGRVETEVLVEERP